MKNRMGSKKHKAATDAMLKARLLELANAGAPKPHPRSVLGRALKRFAAPTMPNEIPLHPEWAYWEEWKGWDDFLGVKIPESS